MLASYNAKKKFKDVLWAITCNQRARLDPKAATSFPSNSSQSLLIFSLPASFLPRFFPSSLPPSPPKKTQTTWKPFSFLFTLPFGQKDI